MLTPQRCTSCSVPLVYKTAQLMAKDLKTGKQVPWDADPDATWIDGSVDNDLPMTRLSEMFNVNHFIVSQVNPHVVPFLSKEEDVIAPEMQQGSALVAGSGWMANAASLARGEVLHRLQVLADIGIFPTYVTKLRGLLNQRYSGDINIFPAISYADFPKVLSNPTTEYMLGCLLTGQRATWPKLSRIQNHLAIELALDDTIQKLTARAVFSPSQANLRLGVLERSNSQGNEYSQGSRTRSSSRTARLGLKTAPSSPLLRRSVPTNLSISQPTYTLPPSASTSRHHLPTKIAAFQHRSAVDGAILDVISSSTNPEDSSDREYFAEIDSDTSEILSSPSPAVSPLSHGPTPWPTSHESLFPCASQPVTPTTSTSSDRRIGTLLNLSMTSATTPAAPSSPELRYKRLFHPPGPVAPAPPDEYPAQLHVESLSSVTPMTPFSERMAKSTPGSRRGSSVGMGGVLDLSGTRGMMRRVKGYKEAEAEAEAEAESKMVE
jgi:TAG lipase/steryl ester hydrolase/phospholipase A2/LPA acyltransferase